MGVATRARWRLNLALALSVALHAFVFASFSTRAGVRNGSTVLTESSAPQPLSVALKPLTANQPLAAPAPVPQPAIESPAMVQTSRRNSATEGSSDPLPLTPIAAAYPEGALAMGIAAKVEVHAVVNEKGFVEQANVVSTTMADVFDRSALAAVRATRFVPAIDAGKPVKSSYRAVIFYDIN